LKGDDKETDNRVPFGERNHTKGGEKRCTRVETVRDMFENPNRQEEIEHQQTLGKGGPKIYSKTTKEVSPAEPWRKDPPQGARGLGEPFAREKKSQIYMKWNKSGRVSQRGSKKNIGGKGTGINWAKKKKINQGEEKK